MEGKKLRTSLLVICVAVAISLSGTFAWQSISPMALNEATAITNPGGRLHDDFSGYGPTDTKDIYVENFGTQNIYARVRLDEYMEIGTGAGLKSGDPNYLSKSVTIVKGKSGADINDVTTWSTHTPDSTLNPGAPHLPKSTANDEFHTYWTWTMGGQAADNPDGKTVYMPTFNKNKDSLRGDINGTLAGLDGDPAAGTPYDDYVPYALTGANSAETGTEYKDADANITDECGPDGGPGGTTGALGANYTETPNVTHNAKETGTSRVITMAEYWALPVAEQETFAGWVYDVDGWAYWSQPIAPDTATGVLLDRIELTAEPSDAWYYGINAVGQFITADDLGRKNNTGFYDPNGGPEPTQDALDLLFGIGVDISSVDGAIPLAAHAQDAASTAVNYAVQDMNIDLKYSVIVPSATPTNQNVTWTLTGNTDPTTHIATGGPNPVLVVGPNETAGGKLRIEAESTAYPGLRTRLVLPVRAVQYNVVVTADGGAASLLPGSTQGFTAKLVSNNFKPGLPQTFNWTLGGSYVGTTGIAAGSPSSGSTLTVDAHESATTITVNAISTDPTYAAAAGTGSITLPVSSVSYNVDITDDGATQRVVTGQTLTVKQNSAPLTYHLRVTSTPVGSTPTGSWTWTSSNPAAATVSGSGTSATVTVPADGTGTTTITATNNSYSPALTAHFDISVEPINYTITLTRMVESGYKDDPTVWYRAYGPSKPAAFDVFGQADADGRIDYAAYSGATVTSTDSVMVKAVVTALDDPQAGTANAVNTAAATVDLTLDGGATPVLTGLKNTDGATAWQLSNNTLGKFDMNGAAAGAHTLSATSTFNNGSFTCAGITLTVAQPKDVINELITNNMHTTLGGVVNIDGVDFYILKKGSVTDSGGAAHHNAALLITRDQIGESVFSTTSPIYEGSTAQKTVTDWVSDRSRPTLRAKAIPVTFNTRSQYSAATPQTTSTSQKAFILSSADIFGDANGTTTGLHTQKNNNDVTVLMYNKGGPLLTADECTPGISLGELYDLIPDGRTLRHGAQYWWLRTPRYPNTNVAYLAWGSLAHYAGALATNSYNNSAIPGGIRPALWFDLT